MNNNFTEILLDNVITKSHNIFNNLEKIPEDDWISLSDEYDLNIFSIENTVGFSIYKVIDGLTQTQEGSIYTWNTK